ncbi:MAG: phosphoribosylaminoimidazolesuccinocarboxamide synthase, partial [Candidatus Wildermuthbacteria bacterium]|nr:phosphoribosylaminoimidazolesuccinocarboxamide synthase [Candidatus Wildermuthbacteria bacterium]
MSPIVTRVDIKGFKWHSGKVRDWTEVDTAIGLRVDIFTDRISAFDVVLPTAIPMKGVVLNQVSNFWKRKLANIIPNDIVSADVSQCLPYLGLDQKSEWAERLRGRIVLARKAEVVPVECVVRGYISGSLWSEYQQARGESPTVRDVRVLGHDLVGDLKESSRLSQSIFTPSTKAASGHDENLFYELMIHHLERWLSEHPEIKRLISANLLAQTLKSTSIALYQQAFRYAWQKGIIIADTKFEFGFINGELTLIDEVLTSDSSRFWDAATYKPGGPQKSYDKQLVRDWLTATGWNKEPPAPA